MKAILFYSILLAAISLFGFIRGASKKNFRYEKYYDKLTEVTYVDNKRNDGDSFLVKTKEGRELEIRLYFVDTPESYFSYKHKRQNKRVLDQAKALGNLTVDQTIRIGKESKSFIKKLLKENSFTLYTYWEKVFSGNRYYGFIELKDGRNLNNILIEKGLARIHTKGPGSKKNPIPTPYGHSFYEHRSYLYKLQSKAKKNKIGAWALN